MKVFKLFFFVTLCLMLASPAMAKRDKCNKALTVKAHLTREYIKAFEKQMKAFLADVVKEAKSDMKSADNRKSIKKLDGKRKQEEAKQMVSDLNKVMKKTLTRLENAQRIIDKALYRSAYNELYDDAYKEIRAGDICAD